MLYRTIGPENLWFYCMLYTGMIIDFLALRSAGWITSCQACFGKTLDISALLQ